MICADLYWIATVRPEGQPHVTPLQAVWADGAMHISTGDDEQKARNIAENPRCTLSTGRNTMDDGLDVIVEGEAVRVTGRERLARLAGMWVAKYGETWRFDVDDDGFHHPNMDELDAGGGPPRAGLRDPAEPRLRVPQGHRLQPDPVPLQRMRRVPSMRAGRRAPRKKMPGSPGVSKPRLGLCRSVERQGRSVPVRSLLTKKIAPPPSRAGVVLDHACRAA